MYATLNSPMLPAHLFAVGIILLIGILIKIFPPKFSDKSYGYRTPLSIKDAEIWNEANRYSSNLFLIYSIVFAVSDFFGYLFIQGPLSFTLPFFTFVLFMLSLIVLTEIHLKRFDKKRKNNTLAQKNK